MKKTSRFSVIGVLEIIALEIGAYTYAALHHQERLHILLETILLCIIAAVIGIIVTRAKPRIVSSITIGLGIVSLGIGLYFFKALDYHERAYIMLGFGILCLIGGLASIAILRSVITALSGVIVLGIVTLSIGIYLLTISGYPGRGFLVLGTGTLYLLGGLIGIIIVRRKADRAATL